MTPTREPLDLEAVKKWMAEASPGPWVDHNLHEIAAADGQPILNFDADNGVFYDRAIENKELIVRVSRIFPALIEEVEKLRGENAAIKKAIRDFGADHDMHMAMNLVKDSMPNLAARIQSFLKLVATREKGKEG